VTAFAAILWPASSHPDLEIEEHVSSALTDLGTRPVRLIRSPGCTQVLSPLHRSDPAGPIQRVNCVASGQVLLEDRDALRHLLRVEKSDDLSIVAAAFERWGAGCASHLRGEFAFAVWDPTRKELVAARDGLCIRLLYTARTSSALVVSNVMAAVCFEPSLIAEIDVAALAEFLANGGPIDPLRTIYRHVRLVPAGHTYRVSPVGETLTRHWDFPPSEPSRARRELLLEGYRAVLASAVRDRAADLGTLFLSGGIDSGTIAASLARLGLSHQVRAVTSTYNRFSTIDEITHAQLTAAATGLTLVQVPGDAHGAMDGLLDSPVPPQPLDEPALADWRAFLGAASAFGTAAVYGEDGDAIFRPPGLRSLCSSESIVGLVAATAAYLVRKRRVPYLGLRIRERLGLHAAPRIMPPSWLTPDATRALSEDSATLFGLHPVPWTINAARRDAQAQLGAQISRDLAGLAAPETSRQRIELRFPLLDTRVISYVMSVPAIPWCQDKALARTAFAGQLPASVTGRAKTGVRGFNEAIVSDWRRRWSGTTRPLPAPLAAWVDTGRWSRALREGTAIDTIAAWRVFELAAWLERSASRSREAAHV
jgi:asparagine synthase (glutamine-hydrolysing)